MEEDFEIVEEEEDAELGAAAAAADAPIVKLVNSLIADAVARSERHPHRAVRKADAGALPHRRRAARDDGAAVQVQGRRSSRASRSWPSSTSPSAACRRTAASRSCMDKTDRPARLDAADDLRREDRDANPRQEQPEHRPAEARVRAGGDGAFRDRDREPLRHGAGRPGRPAPARRRRSTRRVARSTRPRSTS